jgi:Alpha-glucosidases, family 31 of glycosyl hydrolases
MAMSANKRWRKNMDELSAEKFQECLELLDTSNNCITYNAGEAFVVANDYRRGDFKPYIFRTTDYGHTWTRMIDENKVKGYALCMIQDPVEPNLIFVGTEHGLWISLDNGELSAMEKWLSFCFYL